MNVDLAAFLIPLALGAAIGAAGLWAFTHLDRVAGVVGGVKGHDPAPSPYPRLHLVGAGDDVHTRRRTLGRGHCKVVHEPVPVAALFEWDDQLDGQGPGGGAA